MPRYRYMCDECTTIASVIHMIDETVKDCVECKAEDSMRKMLSTPHIAPTAKPPTAAAVGSLTNEYIQMNRELLEEEKIKAQQEEHEPT